MSTLQPPTHGAATPGHHRGEPACAFAYPLTVDHLVVVASSLAEGVDWCEQTLGVTPAPGGEHPSMGTHNRLLNLHSTAFPSAYLEIIAINPAAPNPLPTSARRWFDMDNPSLQEQVGDNGPQLVHWVARVPDLARTLTAWAALGLAPGPATALSRQTPSGTLTWQLTVRPDGQRAMGGCLPPLIQWGNRHPCDSLPTSGVALQQLHLTHPQSDVLAHALGTDKPAAISIDCTAQPGLHAMLSTPMGTVTLRMPLIPGAATP